MSSTGIKNNIQKKKNRLPHSNDNMEELLPKYLKTHTQYLSLCRSREMGCPSYIKSQKHTKLLFFFCCLFRFWRKKICRDRPSLARLYESCVVRDIFFMGKKFKIFSKLLSRASVTTNFLVRGSFLFLSFYFYEEGNTSSKLWAIEFKQKKIILFLLLVGVSA